MLVTQSCQTLCNPMDCSPPGSSVQGIFQVRILGVGWEWVAMPSSRGSSWPKDQTHVSLSLFLCLTKNIYLFIYLLFVNSKVDVTKCQEIGLNHRGKYLRKRVKICSAKWITVSFCRDEWKLQSAIVCSKLESSAG